MKNKLLFSAVVVVIIAGLFVYIKDTFETSSVDYVKEEVKTPAKRTERINTAVADAFIEESDELSLLDTLDELSGETMTERFFAYYDEKIGLDNEDAAIGTRQKVLFDFLASENVDEILNDFKIYTKNDLVVIKTSGESKQNYQNSFDSNILLYVDPDTLENELTIFRRAQNLDSNEEKREELSKLPAIRESYKSLQKSLIATSVPEEAVDIHLDLVNSIGLIVDRIEGMEKLLEDPLLAKAYAAAYEGQASVFIDAYTEVESYFGN